MTPPIDQSVSPDKTLTAVCGLFCPACTFFIATAEDPNRLETLARRRGITAEEARCRGCRSDFRNPFCSTCKMSACAAEKGFDFCVECEEYPCEELQTFQAAAAHRLELWSSQERIRQVGWEMWYEEQTQNFCCPNCGTLNSAYDIKCRRCGAEPSCNYVKLHRAQIAEFMRGRP
jgi:predicted RNA-binding Zn-ribbon protein involved in translation (DUF1610 family)